MESDLHRSMKRMVRLDLESDGYQVLEEPIYPPVGWIHWYAYRPDLIGLRSDENTEQLAVVECETNPSLRRLGIKNHRSLSFEPSVLRQGSMRWILVVPRGKLSSLDLKVRHRWEVWIAGSYSHILKLPSIRGSPP